MAAKKDKPKNYASTMKHRKEAALLATQCIREAESQRLDLKPGWDEAWRLWNQRSISDLFPSDEIKHVPEPFNRCETVVPRLYVGSFGVPHWFSVKSQNKKYVAQEPAIVSLIDWQCSMGDWRFYSDQEDGMRKMAIFGTVVFKDDWHTVTKRVAQREKKTVQHKAGSRLIAETEEQSKDLTFVEDTISYPRGRSLDIGNVYMDRFCDTVEECRYIGDLFELTRSEVEARSKSVDGKPPLYVNTEALLKDESKAWSRDALASKQAKLRKLSFYELWTEMEINGKLIQVVITIGHRLKDTNVVRIAENTFPGGSKPYQVGRYIKRPGEMYGMGAIVPVRGLSKELDEFRTMLSRGMELAINPPFIARDAADLETEQLFLFPGRVIPSPLGPEGLQPINLPVNQMGENLLERQLRNDIAQTSRAPDTWAGRSQSGRETAFEIGKQLQESGLSLGRIIARYRSEVLKPMLRNFLALNHMYLEEKIRIRKLGDAGKRGRESFLELDPQEIQAQFDFEILDVAEVALLGQQSREWISFLGALPEPVLVKIKWDKTLRDILQSMGKDSPEDYVLMEPDEEDMTSAAEENELFFLSHTPDVLPQHNHVAHVAVHTEFTKSKDYSKMTPQQQSRVQQHIKKHYQFAARMFEAQTQQQQKIALGGQPPPQQAGSVPRRAPTNETQGLQRAAAVNRGT